MISLILILVIVCILQITDAFYHPAIANAKLQCVQSTVLRSLDVTTIGILEEMKNKYNRLINVVSPEAEEEIAKIKETVEKYSTYLEVKKLMTKLRSMYKNEASERRKEKQLKSFIDLYKGKLQIEEILKEKLGLEAKKGEIIPDDLVEFQKLEAEIAALEGKLQVTELVLPEGKSTRDARFK